MQVKACARLVVLTVVLAAGLTSAAWGNGFPHANGAPGDRGSFGFGLYAGSALERFVFPCRSACFDVDRGCVEQAKSTAESCVTGACPTQITAAQTACQADRTASGCKTALDALRTCAQPCLETQSSSVSSCRSALSTCVTTCGNS